MGPQKLKWRRTPRSLNLSLNNSFSDVSVAVICAFSRKVCLLYSEPWKPYVRSMTLIRTMVSLSRTCCETKALFACSSKWLEDSEVVVYQFFNILRGGRQLAIPQCAWPHVMGYDLRSLWATVRIAATQWPRCARYQCVTPLTVHWWRISHAEKSLASCRYRKNNFCVS